MRLSQAHKAVESHPPAFIGIQLWPDVEIETELPRRGIPRQARWVPITPGGLSLVEIDHVFNALSITSFNNPVMSIEWSLIAQPSVDPRTRAQELGVNPEAPK